MKNIYKSLSIAFFLLLSNALFGSIEIETPDCVCQGSTISLSITIEADEGFELAEPFSFHWEGLGYVSYLQNPSNIQIPGTYTVTVTNAYGCETILSTEVVQCNPDDPLDIEISSTSACFDDDSSGSASVEASGGERPYTYLWDDENASTESEITDLAPGMYCVTVTDAQGCEVEDCVEVVESTEITVEFEVEASCSGASTGSIVPTVTGGEAPYRYEWSNSSHLSSLNNISEGDYGVIVTDDNGCRILADVNVPEMDSPSIRETITPADCADEDNGSISITIEDGSEPYDIYWEGPDGSEWHGITELNNLAAGDYCVTVTDANGCSETECYSTVADEPQVFMPFIEQVMVTAVVNGGESTLLYDGYWQQIANGMYCFQGGMVNFEGNEDELERLLDAMERGLVVLEVLAYIQGDVSGDIFLDVEGVYYERGTVNLGEVTWGIDVFSTSQLAANNLDAMMTFTHPQLLNLFDASNVYDDCVEIPGLMPDCSWVPNHPQGQDIHSLYLGCTEITFDINYDDDYIYANVLGNASDYRFAWVNSNGQQLGSDQRFYPPADGEYCLIVTNQNTGCRKRECVDFCGGFDEFIAEESYVEYINPCEGMFNGSICIDDEEGDYNFSIEWRNGSNDLCLEDIGAGEYCAFITEHDCEIEVYHCFNLEVVEDISAEITEAIPSCRGRSNGELCVTASGGEPPYYYRWQDGQVGNCITNIAAGEYCVYIKDACGAEYRDCFELGEIMELGFTEININPTCVDADEGSFEVTVKGGRPPYIYTLYDVSGNEVNNGSDTPTDFQHLAQGDYTIEVEDDCGNTIEQNVEITEISEEEGGISASIVDVNAPSCGNDNGSITISASSRGGYYPISYSLFVGGSVVEMGEITNSDEFTISNIEFGVAYTIILTNDIGCTWKTNYQSDVPDSAEDDFEVHHEYSCAPEEGSIQNFISNDHEHEWNFTWSNGSNEPELYHLEAGEYCVTISNSETGECKEACFLVKYIDEPEEIEDNYFTISPEYTCEPGEGSIENALDENYLDNWTYSWSNGSTESEITELEAGSYYLTMTNIYDYSCKEGCFIVESVNTDPEVVKAVVENVNCASSCMGSIDITVNQPQLMSYNWSNGETTQDIDELCPGEYTVTITSGECEEVYRYEVEVEEIDFEYEVEVIWPFESEFVHNGSFSSEGDALIQIFSPQFLDGYSQEVTDPFVISSRQDFTNIINNTPLTTGSISSFDFYIPRGYRNADVFYFRVILANGCEYTGSFPSPITCEKEDVLTFTAELFGDGEVYCGDVTEHSYVINITEMGNNPPYFIEVTMGNTFEEDQNGYVQTVAVPEQNPFLIEGVPSGVPWFSGYNKCDKDALSSVILHDYNCCTTSVPPCEVLKEGLTEEYFGNNETNYFYKLPYFTLWTIDICEFDDGCFWDECSRVYIKPEFQIPNSCWTGIVEIVYPDGSTASFEVFDYNDIYDRTNWLSGEDEWKPSSEGTYEIIIRYLNSNKEVECENNIFINFYGSTHSDNSIGFSDEFWWRTFGIPQQFLDAYTYAWTCGTCGSEEQYFFNNDQSECTNYNFWQHTFFNYTPNPDLIGVLGPCNAGGMLTILDYDDNNFPIIQEVEIPPNVAIDELLTERAFETPEDHWCHIKWWCLFDAMHAYGISFDKPLLATGYVEDSCEEIPTVNNDNPDVEPCDENDSNSCPPGYVCLNGDCYQECTEDFECWDGTCEGGICIPDEECNPSCPNGYECYEGDCFLEEGICGFNRTRNGGGNSTVYDFYHELDPGDEIKVSFKTYTIPDRLYIEGSGINHYVDCISTGVNQPPHIETYEIQYGNRISITIESCGGPNSKFYLSISCINASERMIYNELFDDSSMLFDSKLFVHPNPFASNVDIIIPDVETPFEGEVFLFNYYGDAVVRNKRRIEKGNNSINLEGLDELAGGMYILLLKKDGEVYASKKVVKME